MSIENIFNYLRLSDRIGTSGYPEDNEFHHISDQGYGMVINLVSHDVLHKTEEDIVRSLGLSYIHIPVVWEKPEIKDFKSFADAMEKHQDKKLFIHCEANMRVSAFVMLYRVIHKGMPTQQAMDDVLKIWNPNQNYDQWKKFIETVLAEYKRENV